MLLRFSSRRPDDRCVFDRMPHISVEANIERLERFFKLHHRELPPAARKLTVASVVGRMREVKGLVTWDSSHGSTGVERHWGLELGIAEEIKTHLDKVATRVDVGFAKPAYPESAVQEMGRQQSVYPTLSGPKAHHVFISYYASEMDPVFETLLSTLSAMGLNVFNQRRDLAGVTVNKAEMQAHATGSKVVLPLLSLGYFDSKWCRAEVEAAAEAGVPIVPVYSGANHTESQIKKLMELKSDPVKGAAVKACFNENLIDVHNPAHTNNCISDLQEKVIRRFVSVSSGGSVATTVKPDSTPSSSPNASALRAQLGGASTASMRERDEHAKGIVVYLQARCKLLPSDATKYAQKLVHEVGCTSVEDLTEVTPEQWELIVPLPLPRNKIVGTIAASRLRGKAKPAQAVGGGDGSSTGAEVRVEQVALSTPSDRTDAPSLGGRQKSSGTLLRNLVPGSSGSEKAGSGLSAKLPSLKNIAASVSKRLGSSGKYDSAVEEKVIGLRQVLVAAKLRDREADAVAWFEEEGIESIDDLKEAETENDLVEALKLGKSKAKILLKHIAQYKPAEAP